MGAIKKYYDIRTSIKQILLAGIDIALICHKGPDIQSAYNEILNQVADSREIKDNTMESMKRIIRTKKAYCMVS